MSANVTHLIPFPITNARHGGQIRARETNLALRRAGFSVSTIEIFDAGAYPFSSPTINTSPALASGKWPSAWQISDFVAGIALSEDEQLFAMLMTSLPAKTDLLVFEEPWLGKAVLRLRREGHLDAPIIFNSYNVEHIAKGKILADAEIADSASYLQEIEELEREIITEAAVVSAVTKEDADCYLSMADCNVIIAPNGTVAKNRSHLNGIRFHGVDVSSPYALFVGSGHPPNVSGFKEFVMQSLKWLKSHERVVVAGSVCNALLPDVEKSQTPWIVRDKLCMVGSVSDFELDCLIENSSMLLLPIGYGGGSNLKTAEALITDKPIVATDAAFRGYSKYIGAPGVKFANAADDFGRAMRAIFDDPKTFKRDQATDLLLSHTLSPIVLAAMEAMVAMERVQRVAALNYGSP
ncbi:glycosyltransferase [Agrobacterium rhizogenes]|nr:glycosyltransferase [Rhizobium rhizogenes]NTF74012.1 glycosyltransferase [Rhizobium rhizogenes]